MGSEKFNNKDFSSDMNKYLDKKSKSSSRFLNLEHALKTSKTESVQTETEIVHIKSATPLGHFINKIKEFFSSGKKEDDEEVSLEDIEEVDKEEDDYDEPVEEDEPEDEPEEEDTEKVSFWAKIVAFFKMSDDNEEEHDEDDSEYEELSEEESMREDLKKITIFTKKILKELPRDSFKELKDNGELDEFKTILRKHKIIK